MTNPGPKSDYTPRLACSTGNKFFTVGMPVVANTLSLYEGLRGTVRKIIFPENSDTDGKQVELLCSFELPETGFLADLMERRFAAAFGRKGSLDSLALQEVVLNPEMLEPAMDYQIAPRSEIYVLHRMIDTIGHSESASLAVSPDVNLLKRCMRRDIEFQMENLLKSAVGRTIQEDEDVTHNGWYCNVFWRAQWDEYNTLTYCIETIPILVKKEDIEVV